MSDFFSLDLRISIFVYLLGSSVAQCRLSEFGVCVLLIQVVFVQVGCFECLYSERDVIILDGHPLGWVCEPSVRHARRGRPWE